MKTENTEDAVLNIQIKLEYRTAWWAEMSLGLELLEKSEKIKFKIGFITIFYHFYYPKGENSSVTSCFPVADITV